MDPSETGYVAEFNKTKKLEDERLRLQRQVRTIEADRRGALGIHPQLRRQNQQISTLKTEYIDLAKNLRIAKSGAHKKKDKRMTKDLNRALFQKLITHTNTKGGERLMEELEQLIKQNNKQILTLRKRVNDSKGKLQERRVKSVNRLQSMENKLELATLRFNSIHYENQKIRAQIDHMLKDRAIFNQAWTRILGSLSKGKTFLTDLFEQTTLAYDLRDECCGKLRSLQEKGKMDQMIQMQEMREIQKLFDHDSRLHEFISKKNLQRINRKQEIKEENLKRKQGEEVLRQLMYNKQILNDIHDYAQEYDIDTLIKDFETKEVHNFSLYTLVMDICAESEVLVRDLKRIRQEVIDRRNWNEKKQSTREGKLANLKRVLNEQVVKNENIRQAIEKQNEMLQNVEENILDIFNLLECSKEPFQNLLGCKKPALKTFKLTVSLINQKILEKIFLCYYIEKTAQKKKTEGVTSRLKKYTIHVPGGGSWNPTPINLLVPADPCPQCIEARWLSRLVDKLEAPFTGDMAKEAVQSLANETAYEKYDRIHTLADCRLPRSRMILAKRYNNM